MPIADRARFERATQAFDEANAQDPNTVHVDGQRRPKELVYAERMSAELARFAPDAPEVVQLAARAQHIERWTSPRSDYPMDRTGYLRWRTELGKFHARRAGELMRAVGYDQEAMDTVGKILQKRGLKSDPNVQLLEDVACLVFLRHYYADFIAGEPDDDKVVQIVQRTWRKMSDAAHEAARALPLDGRALELVRRALAA